jgi:hypothetical protein
MIIYGVVILITMTNLLSAKFLSYDPSIDGICVSRVKYSYSKQFTSSTTCVRMHINHVDNSFILRSEGIRSDLNHVETLNKRWDCSINHNNVWTCKLPNTRMTVKPDQEGKNLAMELQFFNGNEFVMSVWFLYDMSVEKYDPNIKKFEQYVKWLAN